MLLYIRPNLVNKTSSPKLLLSTLNSFHPSPESNQFSSNQYKRCCTCCSKERCWSLIRCSLLYPPLMSRCVEGWMSLSNIACVAKLRSPPQTKCCWTRPVRVNWRWGNRPFGLKCWWCYAMFISCPMMHFFDLYLVQLWWLLSQLQHHLLFTRISTQTQTLACLLIIKMGWFWVYNRFHLWSIH